MEKRQTELDILRLGALLAVIGLHICSGVQKQTEFLSPVWLSAALLRFTWAVPVFVMLSGHFLLQRELPLKTLWSKYMRRILTAYVFWSAVYQLYYLVCDLNGGRTPDWKGYAASFFTGAYHMWYLWMLLGLYLITPILQKIAGDRKLTAYYLLLSFGVQCGRYFLCLLPGVGHVAQQLLDKMHLDFVAGFAAYFLLGHFLQQWTPTKKQEVWLYAAGILAMLTTATADLALSAAEGSGQEHFAQYLSPLTAVQAAALYTFFVRRVSRLDFSQRVRRFFGQTAQCGLGAYLSHGLILELCRSSVLWDRVTAAPLVGIPLLTLFAGGVSLLCAGVLRRIPRWGKTIA